MPDNIRDHRGDTTHHTPHPPPDVHGPSDVFVDHRKTGVKHVFVLMLENRSFDHMLGFSGITGTDPATNKPTKIEGLTGNESNTFEGKTFKVSTGAADVMTAGPAHEFADVLEQMCGAGVTYRGGHYPAVNNSGYVANYSRRSKEHPGDAMKCFAPDRLPILTTLAKEFCVLDHWFSSMPGPTQPNRMYAHAATSGQFDDSPTHTEEAEMNLPYSGLRFSKGTIFDRLAKAKVPYRIYAGDHFPNVGEIEGIGMFDIREIEDFAEDLKHGYDAGYTWIEPEYDALDSFDSGDSQHPLGSIHSGEALIKKVYEAIRNSPVWETSMLVITYDEHGGFYDHVIPRTTFETGATGRAHGFNFQQLGPRVPAIVVSPLVPKNLIEHRPFEHSAIPALVERVFEIHDAMTMRDGRGNAPNYLATLPAARTDTPRTLPTVAGVAAKRVPIEKKTLKHPMAPVQTDPEGHMQALLRVAVRYDLALHPTRKEQILARARTIQTRAQLLAYMQELHPQIKAKKVSLGTMRAHVG